MFYRFIWSSLSLANVNSEMEKPIDFWLRKGKAVGETKPTEIPEGRAEVTTFYMQILYQKKNAHTRRYVRFSHHNVLTN